MGEKINLQDVLYNKEDVVGQLRLELKTRGYSFVQLPKYIISQADACKEATTEFFKNITAYKERFFREPIFGWFEVEHKEVFRFITGQKLHLQNFPLEVEKEYIQLGNSLDLLMPKLACILFPNVDQQLKSILPFHQWGLIDVVRYNNQVIRPDNLNIVEHYDPGLFSLSVLSTEPGFQFRNEFGEWVDPPMNTGMIWTGHAVRLYDETHPEGVHRVTKSTNPRYSIWYEMATFDQERNDMLSNQHVGYEYELELMKKAGYEPVRNDDGTIKNYKHIETNNINKSIGFRMLEANTTGSNKTAIGYAALASITPDSPASNYVAIGFQELETHTPGTNRVAIGTAELQLNTSDSQSVALGTAELRLGFKTLESITTGSNKTVVGDRALANNRLL